MNKNRFDNLIKDLSYSPYFDQYDEFMKLSKEDLVQEIIRYKTIISNIKTVIVAETINIK
tara:strand:- start:193 stop:372 length:180 start_codon:yes stop_codon:yes gene_type:complete